MSPKEIGEKLRELRGNMPREDAAKNYGVSVSAVQMYENGERVPRDETKKKIADYYGVKVGSLFYGE